MRQNIHSQFGSNDCSLLAGIHLSFSHIICISIEPSGRAWPSMQETVQLFPSQSIFDVCDIGIGGQVLFIFSHCGPSNLSGHSHFAGDLQTPPFLHGGLQAACMGKLKFEIFCVGSFYPDIKYLRSQTGLSLFSKPSNIQAPALHNNLALVFPFAN